MHNEKIKGGYILLARKLLDSGIMEKPPLWLKLFLWMLLKANRTEGYKGLKEGEFYTSISEMREAMAHYVGARKNTPTAKQIRVIYENLSKGLRRAFRGAGENDPIIEVAKVTGGLKITILNYSEYQNPKNYEGHKKTKTKKQVEGHDEKFSKSFCRAHLISKQEEYKKKQEINKFIFPEMIDFVVGFIFYVQEEKPKFGPNITKTFLENSYKTIVDLCRLDGFEFEYVRAVVRWAKQDDFWAENLLSLTTLRKKSKTNELKKFQNIAKSYESEKKKQIQPVKGNSGRSEQNAQACYDFVNG